MFSTEVENRASPASFWEKVEFSTVSTIG